MIERMQALLGPLQAADDPNQIFHATYLRTTIAVAEEIRRPGGFTDPEWTERWDVAFADLYLEALERLQACGKRQARALGPTADHRYRASLLPDRASSILMGWRLPGMGAGLR